MEVTDSKLRVVEGEGRQIVAEQRICYREKEEIAETDQDRNNTDTDRYIWGERHNE